MARHREFDEEQVLDFAMQAFWNKGYEGTSISELEAVTQLSRGSLYKAFGDKHTLFLLTLKRYLSRVHQKIRTTLNSDLSLQEALTESFNLMHVCKETNGNGCFALNSGFEFGQQDPAVKQLLEHHQQYVIRLLMERLERAQMDGEIRKDISVEQVAELLLLLQAGALVQAKQHDNPEMASPHAERFLALLLK